MFATGVINTLHGTVASSAAVICKGAPGGVIGVNSWLEVVTGVERPVSTGV